MYSLRKEIKGNIEYKWSCIPRLSRVQNFIPFDSYCILFSYTTLTEEMNENRVIQSTKPDVPLCIQSSAVNEWFAFDIVRSMLLAIERQRIRSTSSRLLLHNVLHHNIDFSQSKRILRNLKVKKIKIFFISLLLHFDEAIIIRIDRSRQHQLPSWLAY